MRARALILLTLLATALAAAPAAASPGPLAGMRFYVDPPSSLAGTVIQQIRGSRPDAAAKLQAIADQPETKRFGTWDGDPTNRVRRFLAFASAAHPGLVPLLATYRLEHRTCGEVSDAPQAIADYEQWYRQFAAALGTHRVVVFLEIDALMTAGCLSRHGLAVRVEELRSAIGSLAAAPNAIVYVDGAAADVGNPRFYARVLKRIGVGRIAGVFTNGTHQDWTSHEIRYGEQLAKRVPGLRYVVNTATNGRGPLRPKNHVADGNTIHCNPPGRGLGPRPTTAVPARYPHLDAFAWVGQPGRSAGACSATPGAPPSGTFWVDYALMLIADADYRIR